MTSSHGDHADAVVQRLFRASLEVTSALALADDHAAGPLREVIEHPDAAIRLIQGQKRGVFCWSGKCVVLSANTTGPLTLRRPQTGSPVVELNRAIAVAEIDGPAAGLAILDHLDHYRYRYFHSARADLLRRAGRNDQARLAYQRALELAQTEAERRSLNEQLAKLPHSE